MHESRRQLRVTGKLLKQFSQLVDDIYSASLDPRQWPKAVCGVADLHSCRGALLLTPATAPADGGFMFPVGITEADMHRWATRYVQHDPWVAAARDMNAFRSGNVFFSEDLLSRRELEKTVFYTEYLKGLGVGGFCTGVIFDGADGKSLPTACSFFGGLEAPAFSQQNKDLHAMTVSHLSRSLGVMYRLRDAELRIAATHTALDRIGSGIVILAREGNVLFANETAQRLLRRQDGIRLRSGNAVVDEMGWLRADVPSEEALLKKSIRLATSMDTGLGGHFSEGLLITRSGHPRPYLVQISPLGAKNEFASGTREASAICFISELDQAPPLDESVLATSFGLTPSEIRVATQLLTGASLDGCAKALQLTPNTLKTHIKSIFGKTRTNRQAELMKLLLSLRRP